MTRPNTTFSKKTRLFSPSVVRHLHGLASSVVGITSANISGSSLELSSSFRYDPIGAPLRSTQQIPVDWSDFSNHTFFNSAESKVNIAFERIINGFPFDGSREEFVEYVDSLTGFEKYVLDLFPKNVGFLNLGGVNSAGSLLETHVSIKDVAGNYDPAMSRNKTGKSVLDTSLGTMVFEFFIYPPTGSSYAVSSQTITLPTGDRSVVQRLNASGTQGFGIYFLSGTHQSTTETMQMIVSSGSFHISSSILIDKGAWTHVSFQINRSPNINKIQVYKNGDLAATSSAGEIGDFGYLAQDLLIGSGTTHTFVGVSGQPPSISIQPSEILSASIDELRIFHGSRTSSVIKNEMLKNIFPRDSLKLYLKFNEPQGNHTTSDLLLDSSGNSLHAQVINYDNRSRAKNGIAVPVLYEDLSQNPVLFPGFQTTMNLNESLLLSASNYDTNNPNLITKLIPQHYLQEASSFEGLNTETNIGNAGDAYGFKKNFPGGGKVGSPQIIASILFLWAKYFDELKMYLDQFGKLLFVDVLEEGTVADNFLPFLAEYYGLTLPRIVDNVSLNQLIDNESLTAERTVSSKPLKKIQYLLWRRILSDINEVIESKGTLHSIRSLMLNLGINPDNNFRFKEFGGSRTHKITDARIRRSAVFGQLEMSSSYSSIGSESAQGIISDSPFVMSKFLFASRSEPGLPAIDLAGSSRQNGMFTSGSWSYEAIYKFSNAKRGDYSHPMTQSLVRLCTTGTRPEHYVYANLVALSSSLDLGLTGTLLFYARPQPGMPVMTIPITGVNIYDGNNWHLSFGRQKNDSISMDVSSSYFLRATRAVGGKLLESYSTSSMFNDHHAGTINLCEKINSSYNASGTFFVIGKQILSSAQGPGYGFTTGIGVLNDTDVGSNLNVNTSFGGKVSRIRFWSKYLTEQETREHALNVESLGVRDPKKNFNFNMMLSGSFERLRLDVSMDQPITQSSTLGKIELFDFSQNKMHVTGTGFIPSSRVIQPENFEFSILSPYFESSISNNKVRIRSFTEQKNIEKFGASIAPLHRIPSNEAPKDDTRFSIEVSLVQALNEDIMNIFSTLDTFDNIIGDPSAQFSDDYRDLSEISDIYFNRLTGKINASRYFDFFKWFDTTVGDTIENLLPRKTKFLGSNFVIESHVLERTKFVYNNYDMYIGPNDRFGLKGQILLQQFVAELLRF